MASLDTCLVYDGRQPVGRAQHQQRRGEQHQVLVLLVGAVARHHGPHLDEVAELLDALPLPAPDGPRQHLQLQLLLLPRPRGLAGRLLVEADAALRVAAVDVVVLEVLLDLLYGPGQPLQLAEGSGEAGGEHHEPGRLAAPRPAPRHVVQPGVELVAVPLQDADCPGVVGPVGQVGCPHTRAVLTYLFSE